MDERTLVRNMVAKFPVRLDTSADLEQCIQAILDYGEAANAFVREFAEGDPYTYDLRSNVISCRYCFKENAAHDKWCYWRRAQELVRQK